jgi:hypothetical protein
LTIDRTLNSGFKPLIFNESVTAGPQRRSQFPWELQLLPTAATLQLYCIAWTHLSHKTPRRGRRATLPDLSFCVSRVMTLREGAHLCNNIFGALVWRTHERVRMLPGRRSACASVPAQAVGLRKYTADLRVTARMRSMAEGMREGFLAGRLTCRDGHSAAPPERRLHCVVTAPHAPRPFNHVPSVRSHPSAQQEANKMAQQRADKSEFSPI